MVGAGGVNDVALGGDQVLGGEDIVDTKSDAAMFAGGTPAPRVHRTPRVVESAAEVEVGITEGYRIEIAGDESYPCRRLYRIGWRDCPASRNECSAC